MKLTERRKSERKLDYLVEELQIEVDDSFTPPVFRDPGSDLHHFGFGGGIRLVDFSGEGVGVSSRVPLAVGSVVEVTGDFHSVDSCWRLQARSRVAHCLAQDDGTFRMGLAFLEQTQRLKLDCTHEPGFSLSLDPD